MLDLYFTSIIPAIVILLFLTSQSHTFHIILYNLHQFRDFTSRYCHVYYD